MITLVMQIAEWLRGYSSSSKDGKHANSDEHGEDGEHENLITSFGAGASLCLGLSEAAWRVRTRQAWLCGFLERSMHLGHGQGRITSMVFNSYSVTAAGEELLTSPTQVLLPCEPHRPVQARTTATANSTTSIKQIRKSKGNHLLPTLTKLLSSRENWYDIKNTEDYQYPGKFKAAPPQRLGFAQDITTFSFYSKDDEHFLFNDIQIGKGKLRAARKVTTAVDGIEEELYYRIAPCGGVKRCPVKECTYTVSTKEHRSCPNHAEQKLELVNECPVEFVYVWPADEGDKRRWLSGIVRTGDLKSSNLHNHPLNGPTKVPSKVVHDIQHALELDPTLKTHDLITGM